MAVEKYRSATIGLPKALDGEPRSANVASETGSQTVFVSYLRTLDRPEDFLHDFYSLCTQFIVIYVAYRTHDIEHPLFHDITIPLGANVSPLLYFVEYPSRVSIYMMEHP